MPTVSFRCNGNMLQPWAKSETSDHRISTSDAARRRTSHDAKTDNCRNRPHRLAECATTAIPPHPMRTSSVKPITNVGAFECMLVVSAPNGWNTVDMGILPDTFVQCAFFWVTANKFHPGAVISA